MFWESDHLDYFAGGVLLWQPICIKNITCHLAANLHLEMFFLREPRELKSLVGQLQLKLEYCVSAE